MRGSQTAPFFSWPDNHDERRWAASSLNPCPPAWLSPSTSLSWFCALFLHSLRYSTRATIGKTRVITTAELTCNAGALDLLLLLICPFCLTPCWLNPKKGVFWFVQILFIYAYQVNAHIRAPCCVTAMPQWHMMIYLKIVLWVNFHTSWMIWLLLELRPQIFSFGWFVCVFCGQP